MFIFLFCTLVVMLAALIKFYYDVNKENNQAYLDSNIITDLSTDKTNYKIIRNDDGMSVSYTHLDVYKRQKLYYKQLLVEYLYMQVRKVYQPEHCFL